MAATVSTSGRPRPIVIGAGINGLTAAFYLARAGLAPLVLERGDRLGGAARPLGTTPEQAAPAFAHSIGPIDAAIAADMQLERRGVHVIVPEIVKCTPARDGRALLLHRDGRILDSGDSPASERDRRRYSEFVAELAALGRVLQRVMRAAPPSLDRPSGSDLLHLLNTGRALRRLGRSRVYRALRWGPMPIADLVEDWFESDILRATIAARGVFGSALGPRSAGTAALLLLEAARHPETPLAPAYVRGGPGVLVEAMRQAASEAGAEFRTGADAASIDADDDGVTRVVLRSGEGLRATTVVSSLDPKRTLLDMIDPVRLDPSVLQRMRNFRSSGTVAKLTLTLDGLPAFPSLVATGRETDALRARLIIASDVDDIERAFDASKYGRWSDRPWLECVIPTAIEASPAAGEPHVMSVYAQYAPYALRDTDWTAERDRFASAVIARLAEYAPDLPSRIRTVDTLAPPDLERELGMTGGHIFHGEMALDQLYVMRPMLGWSQYRTPIRGLYLCGAGTHPGGGLTGLNGRHAAQAVAADLGQ